MRTLIEKERESSEKFPVFLSTTRFSFLICFLLFHFHAFFFHVRRLLNLLKNRFTSLLVDWHSLVYDSSSLTMFPWISIRRAKRETTAQRREKNHYDDDHRRSCQCILRTCTIIFNDCLSVIFSLEGGGEEKPTTRLSESQSKQRDHRVSLHHHHWIINEESLMRCRQEK